jgi:hypothetical protein
VQVEEVDVVSAETFEGGLACLTHVLPAAVKDEPAVSLDDAALGGHDELFTAALDGLACRCASLVNISTAAY